MTGRTRAALRLLTCLALELAALAALYRLPSATPPFDRSIVRWWTARDPLDAAAGVGRSIAVLGLAYVVVVTSLHMGAVLTRGRRLGRVATVLGPRFLVGIAASVTLAAPAASAADGQSSSAATMEVVDGPHTALPWASASAPTTTPPTATPTTVVVLNPTQPAQPAPAPPPPTEANRGVVVAKGDSMWTIARDELAARLGRTPTVAEIDPYWRALIEANRDRLVDRADPSLIYSGQTFVLP
jgi:hypothetical protein